MARKPRKPVEPPVGPPASREPASRPSSPRPPSLPPPPPPPPDAPRGRAAAGTRNAPQGPPAPVESQEEKNAKAARIFLEKTRSEDEIEGFLDSCHLGLSFAELFGYFYPYRNYVTGKRGLLNAPDSRVPKDSITLYDPDSDQEADVTYSERLRDRVDPQGVQLSLGHARLRAEAPLAPLSAIAVEMLQFMDTFSVLRQQVARLRRVFGADPKRVKKRLISMRARRQMLCACVMLDIIEKNKTRKKQSQIELPSSGELRALAGLVHLEEYNPSELSPEAALRRVKAWDELRRDVLRGVVPFLETVLSTPLDDPDGTT